MGIPVDLDDETMEIGEDLGDGDDVSELEAGEYEDEEFIMHNSKPLPQVVKSQDWVHSVVKRNGNGCHFIFDAMAL